MLPYCLRCRKNKESKSSTFVRTKTGRKMLLSNFQCVVVRIQNLLKGKKLVDYFVV